MSFVSHSGLPLLLCVSLLLRITTTTSSATATGPQNRLLMLHSAVLVITVYTDLQLVSTSRMRSVMLTYIQC